MTVNPGDHSLADLLNNNISSHPCLNFASFPSHQYGLNPQLPGRYKAKSYTTEIPQDAWKASSCLKLVGAVIQLQITQIVNTISLQVISSVNHVTFKNWIKGWPVALGNGRVDARQDGQTPCFTHGDDYLMPVPACNWVHFGPRRHALGGSTTAQTPTIHRGDHAKLWGLFTRPILKWRRSYFQRNSINNGNGLPQARYNPKSLSQSTEGKE